MTDGKKRILVVDDEPNNLQLMMQVLDDLYQLAFAANGAKALEIVTKIEPDLILLDIMMPGMDGYEVCRRLKADELTASIPIIFVTAKGETDDEAKGLEQGAIDYITKPVSPAIVRARIENHLALKSAREEIENKNKILEAQNRKLKEAARLREDVEHITRHDLKTPLNAIIALPRMIRKGVSHDRLMKYVDMIENSGLNMLNMINFSLDLFKMEREIYTYQPEPVNIRSIIGKILDEILAAVRKKDLSPMVMIDDSPAGEADSFYLQGEELLCYSMLSNLIKNAVEASPPGNRITISLDHGEDESIIRIHNMGAVPDDIRDRFFEKYVTSGKKAGTGLGTYSARLIAEIHGGSIQLDSSEEKGTTVMIRLPGRNMAETAVSISPAALGGMPAELTSRLEAAAMDGDMAKITATIEAIRSHDAGVADTLASLAGRFEHDVILDLIRGTRSR